MPEQPRREESLTTKAMTVSARPSPSLDETVRNQQLTVKEPT
ncbi:hypothetical protein [Lysobacter gummosus]